MTINERENLKKTLLSLDPRISYRTIAVPLLSEVKEQVKLEHGLSISSDSIIKFLENLAPLFEFDYIGYEIKTVEEIEGIYLMVNPDPRNFSLVPPKSLVICHRKISVHKNRVYSNILTRAKEKKFNIYNFSLGWDIMNHGIGDSFLESLGFSRKHIEKVDLIYKGHKIPRFGSLVREVISMEELGTRLINLNVHPSMIINPQCDNSIIGYIPGRRINDEMIVEMAEAGVGVLICSDPQWHVEIVARELGMTLISIDHYVSDRYGLQPMQKILTMKFPQIHTKICENLEMRQLDSLFQDLVNITLRDKKISEDEKVLVKSIYQNINTFKEAYKEAWEDDIITEKEKSLLTHLWNRIFDKSVEIAQEDNIISLDELKLLMSVFRTIHHSDWKEKNTT